MFRKLETIRPVAPDVPFPGTSAALVLREPEAPALPAPIPAPFVPATPAAVAAEVVSATDEDICLARQKANYCHAVWTLSRDSRISVQDACTAVATRAQDFPGLATGGKGGASMLAGSRAFSNYRAWTARMGKVGRAPDTDNWRALLPKYTGSREYVRPGADEFWVLFARIYENPNRFDLSKAYDLAAGFFRKAGNFAPEAVPTVGQVRHYYKTHRDRKELIVAREGEEVFRNTVADYIRRDAPGVDEVWVGDHHVFDFAIRTWDTDKGCWKAVRPWLTAWFDWGSGSFVGWVIRAIAPNRDSIERALRDAIRKNNLHPPAALYIDNGKDYKACGFARAREDDERLGTVAARLGCKVTFATPYNARAKVIERNFAEVCEGFSKAFQSYLGNCPANRPEHAEKFWNDPDSLHDLDQLNAQFGAWLATCFHEQPSAGKALKGRTPNQARASFPRPRPALDPVLFHRAFLREQGVRKIGRGGSVMVGGREYQSPELYTLLANVPEVLVKLDPDDVSQAWIFHPDGREIGPAREVKSLAPMLGDEATTEQIEDLREGIKRQRRQISEAKAGSAGARALGRFQRDPAEITGAVFGEAPRPIAASEAPARARRPSAPVEVSTAEDAAAMEETLRALTATRLSSRSLPAGDEA